ncbi:hypothetical protein LCGC14_0924790 [marine sediment metagenome]|uniref:Uncharacterized protein n=1 Tax=marine sediment metagenome TaxID=412755 RepID=A0A0F9R8G1_9ZZZZ
MSTILYIIVYILVTSSKEMAGISNHTSSLYPQHPKTNIFYISPLSPLGSNAHYTNWYIFLKINGSGIFTNQLDSGIIT